MYKLKIFPQRLHVNRSHLHILCQKRWEKLMTVPKTMTKILERKGFKMKPLIFQIKFPFLIWGKRKKVKEKVIKIKKDLLKKHKIMKNVIV